MPDEFLRLSLYLLPGIATDLAVQRDRLFFTRTTT